MSEAVFGSSVPQSGRTGQESRSRANARGTPPTTRSGRRNSRKTPSSCSGLAPPEVTSCWAVAWRTRTSIGEDAAALQPGLLPPPGGDAANRGMKSCWLSPVFLGRQGGPIAGPPSRSGHQRHGGAGSFLRRRSSTRPPAAAPRRALPPQRSGRAVRPGCRR